MRSSDNGTTWKSFDNDLKNVNVLFQAVCGDNLFSGTETDGVFVSSDSGTTWRAVNNGLASKGIRGMVTCGNAVFVSTKDGVFRTIDNGANWTLTGMKDNLNFLGANDRYLFAGKNHKVSYSTDSGATWTNINAFFQGSFITGFAASGTTLFVAVSDNGVFYSQDNGVSWTLGGTQGITDIHYLNALATYGTNLFLGTALGGIYWSNDNAKTWKAVNTGLKSLYVFRPTIIAHNGYLFVSVVRVLGPPSTANISRRPLSEILPTQVESLEDAPSDFFLMQNHPNPFNAQTEFSFSLPVQDRVSLKLYDALGRQVAVVLDAELDRGFHSVDFNASGLVSGVYYYKLQTSQFVQTKSLVLQK